MSNRPSFIRKALVTGALVTGVGFGAAGIASAATGGSTSSSSGSSSATAPSTGAPTAPPAGAGGRMDPAATGHGPGETLLTGTDQQKADAAATAAVPGATVIRAETDSSGASTYEVHMKKTDGTYVTVELDSSFNVITTNSGFGPGPAGQAPHGASDGTAPDGGPGPNGGPGAYGGSAATGNSSGSSTAA